MIVLHLAAQANLVQISLALITLIAQVSSVSSHSNLFFAMPLALPFTFSY